MTKKEINIKSRIRKIHFIYKYELLNIRLDLKDAFENYNFSEDDLKNLENIEKCYGELKIIIVKNLKNTWSWERLNPLERAILIEGSYELKFIDKGIVINEMVDYSKKYLLDNKYKFINGMLDKISSEYAKTDI